MQTESEGRRDEDHALTIILQQWNIQYHTTQGMNTRIAALFAFGGVVLAFLLQSGLIQQHDFLATAGALCFLGSVLCLLWAASTRWASELPPVERLAETSSASAAKAVETIVKKNRKLLRDKSKWLVRGLRLAACGIVLVTLSVFHDAYFNSHDRSSRLGSKSSGAVVLPQLEEGAER